MRIGAVSRPWHRRLYVNASNECGTSFTRSGYRGATRIHSTARGFNSTAVRLAPKKVRGVRKIQREITIQLEQRVANTVGFLKVHRLHIAIYLLTNSLHLLQSIPAKIAQALANFAKYMVDLFWRIVEDPTVRTHTHAHIHRISNRNFHEMLNLTHFMMPLNTSIPVVEDGERCSLACSQTFRATHVRGCKTTWEEC